MLRVLLRYVVRDEHDIHALAALLGCEWHEALDIYLTAKRGLQLTVGTNRVEGEQLLQAIRGLPSRLRAVACEMILFGRTITETAAELALPPVEVDIRFEEAKAALRQRFPNIAV